MKRTMRAVGVIPGRREVTLVDHEMPEVTADDEVKVRSLETGVCGTDKEICTFAYGSPPSGSEYLVLGHESLGEVAEVGSEVSGFKKGDLVVPSVRRPCPHDHCMPCRAGMQDFCSTGDFTERGIKMRHGYMAEFYVEKGEFLNPVPADLRDVAVLVEPLTVAEKALAQIWQLQSRLPWAQPKGLMEGKGKGHGLRALVLGAGPIGILGTMAFLAQGFETYVYSRSLKPNPKAELVESLGAPYISAKEVPPHQLAERLGNIDVVYEAVGVARVSFHVLNMLGTNGIFVFTGIPAPRAPVELEADLLMRNLVLKNQVVVGTVNANKESFQGAIQDLGVFKQRWPDELRGLITGRYSLDSYRDLLVNEKAGIKNVIAME